MPLPSLALERYRVPELSNLLVFELHAAGTKRHQLISGPLRRSIRAEAVAAQDRPARRRLEGHGVVLAALVARDFESLTLTCLSSSAAEVGPSRIAACLTAFWMSQITFLVILLFPFSKCERSVALRTRDFEV